MPRVPSLLSLLMFSLNIHEFMIVVKAGLATAPVPLLPPPPAPPFHFLLKLLDFPHNSEDEEEA